MCLFLLVTRTDKLFPSFEAVVKQECYPKKSYHMNESPRRKWAHVCEPCRLHELQIHAGTGRRAIFTVIGNQ
jgi:hypothetical protein